MTIESSTPETETTETSQATDPAPGGAGATGDGIPESTGSASSSTQQRQEHGSSTPPGLPFHNGGKEKFVIDGKTVEWDWETTKRYAQKGRAGEAALQRASDTERKAREFFGKLQQAAKVNPQEAIRILTGDPNWRLPAQQGAGETHQDNGDPQDPRDQKIAELSQRLERFESSNEQREIQAERDAIAKEITDAESKYPELKGNKFAISHLKAEYRRHLNNGRDVSIDDLAFEVAQEIKEQKAAAAQGKEERINTNRKNAPVTTAPGAPASKPKTFDSFEAVRQAAKNGEIK